MSFRKSVQIVWMRMLSLIHIYIYPLLDCILENIPAPEQLEGTPQLLVTSLDYSSYTGPVSYTHLGIL